MNELEKVLQPIEIKNVNDIAKLKLDKEAVKNEIDKMPIMKVEQIVVTEGNYKEQRETLAEINKVAKQVSDFRLAPKRALKKFVDEFEGDCKEIEDYIKGKYNLLKDKTEVFYEDIRNENKKIVEETVKELSSTNGLRDDFKVEIDEKWLNVSNTPAKIRKEVESAVGEMLMKQQAYDTKFGMLKAQLDIENENLKTPIPDTFIKELMVGDETNPAELIKAIHEKAESQKLIEKNTTKPTENKPKENESLEDFMARQSEIVERTITLRGANDLIEEAIQQIKASGIEVK